MASPVVKKTMLYDKFKEELPRVDGKVFVITGTTSGTGFVAAKCVAEKGGEAVLLNRSSLRVEEMMTKLKEAVPNGKFISIECDLQDFSSVRKAIGEIKKKYKQVYCLCANAGVLGVKDERTVDGYDTQMQTNHLSHFLLTAELFPLLEAEAKSNGDARIVQHSSDARNRTRRKRLEEQYFDKCDPGTLGGDHVPKFGLMGGPRLQRYCQSKLANSVFTQALHNKLQENAFKNNNTKIRSIAAHPGAATTNISDVAPEATSGVFWKLMIRTVIPLLVQSAEDGALGILRGMMDPTAESGQLYGPAGSNIMSGPALANPLKKYETDKAAIDMLWRKSEEATCVKFSL